MAYRSWAGAVPVLPFVGGRVFSRRALGVVIALLCACEGSAVAIRDRNAVVDDGGRRVALEPAPRRIISLLPSATELLVALGAGDRLIARTDYDAQPGLTHLPSFGRNITASVESIVALEPDLVVVPADYLTVGLGARLTYAGVRVYEADVQRLDALAGTVRRLATLLDARACGDSLLAALRAGLDSVRDAYAKGDPVDVAFAVWHAPASVAGGDTYVDDVIRAAGGRNAFGDVSGWPEISAEALIARDPDVIIVPAGGGSSLRPEWLRSAPGWRALRAVREGRVIVVDADLFERPGTRVVEAAGTLARALHTERAR